MTRISPRHVLTFLVAAGLVALAGVGIATTAKPAPTKLAGVRDASTGLPTGQRSHKPF
jgi:hypothetical protein